MRARTFIAFLAGVLATVVAAVGVNAVLDDDEDTTPAGTAGSATPTVTAAPGRRPAAAPSSSGGVAEIVERVFPGVVYVDSGQGPARASCSTRRG